MGGTSSLNSDCTGILQVKHQKQWKPVDGLSYWDQKSSSVVCRQLECGPAVSTKSTESTSQPVWTITSACNGSETSLKECGPIGNATTSHKRELTCSGINDFNNDSNIYCTFMHILKLTCFL